MKYLKSFDSKKPATLLINPILEDGHIRNEKTIAILMQATVFYLFFFHALNFKVSFSLTILDLLNTNQLF